MRLSLAFACAFCLVSFPALADDASCIANGKVDGSFLSGRKYDASEELPNADVPSTFRRIDIYVLQDGWRINQADSTMGIISASRDVNGSNGKQLTLNIIVEKLGTSGSKASATLQLGSGQGTWGDNKLLEGMCGMLTGTGKPG